MWDELQKSGGEAKKEKEVTECKTGAWGWYRETRKIKKREQS